MAQQDTGGVGVAGISLRDTVQAFRTPLRLADHRGLVWLSGEPAQVGCVLDDLLKDEAGVILWTGGDAPDRATPVEAHEVSRWLGAECDALVFDARSGFEPDAFGALSGTLRGGGLLYLLTPARQAWPEQPDRYSQRQGITAGQPPEPPRRYLQRLATLLTEAPGVLWIEDGVVRQTSGFTTDSSCRHRPASTGGKPDHQDGPCLTADQQLAVTEVMHVVSGHRRRPVVLLSDRGRGKSAAFGIAAARLIAEQGKHILVTAARRRAVDTLMQQTRSMLSPAQCASLCFVAPDVLAQQPQPADLLLVDEAAAIPAPLLETLLKHYPRMAFATTVHGYEGTGRGFALRFNAVLDRLSNSWKNVTLQTPIRWAPDDPLEALTFRLLMLDAAAAPDKALRESDTREASIECIERDQLAQDEVLLRELFGLLVLAHYKTQPSDLRQLLDATNLSVTLLRLNGHVAAVALVADEGGFDREQAEAIVAGTRRPYGHLLPETLAVHLGRVEAPLQRAARVMRIAVHPAVQGRGLGSQLLAHIGEASRQAGYDYLGSSFGASARLLRFWDKAGLQPVRVSERRSASSGYHSVVVMKSLSERGERLFTAARQRFLRHFPHQLSDSLRDLETPLVIALMRRAPDSALTLTADDREDIRRFACERRFLESAIGALWPWLCNCLMSPQSLDALDAAGAELLVARILQKRDWAYCARRAGLTGHNQVLEKLRGLVRQLLE